MRLFLPFYQRVMQWSRHRHAPWYLGVLSFADSSFFPIPPDVMLAPMCLARPPRALFLALLTTLTSVAGGVFGYLIGAFAFDIIAPWVSDGGHYAEAFEQARLWFEQWGLWAVLLAGFSPIPYKIFTVSAGFLSMSLLPFVLASIIGRGSRFFLVAILMAWGGPAMEERLRHWVDGLGWLTVVLIVVLVVILYL